MFARIAVQRLLFTDAGCQDLYTQVKHVPEAVHGVGGGGAGSGGLHVRVKVHTAVMVYLMDAMVTGVQRQACCAASCNSINVVVCHLRAGTLTLAWAAVSPGRPLLQPGLQPPCAAPAYQSAELTARSQ